MCFGGGSKPYVNTNLHPAAYATDQSQSQVQKEVVPATSQGANGGMKASTPPATTQPQGASAPGLNIQGM